MVKRYKVKFKTLSDLWCRRFYTKAKSKEEILNKIKSQTWLLNKNRCYRIKNIEYFDIKEVK